MRPTLDQALCALARGDRDAFDAVYELAWPRVRALSLRLLPNDPDAEDVAQQALLSVFERASDYDPDLGRALPWILGITGWTVRTHRQRQHRRREVCLDQHPVADGDLESAVIERDLLRTVTEAIGAMSELDQETLLAQLHGTGAGPTYRKRLERAIRRLRTRWWRIHGT